MKKKVWIAIAALLIMYFLFVTIDCIRLRNAPDVTKPLITVSLAEYENGNKYTGLGYSVKYYKSRQEDTNRNIIEYNYGAEFRLFDKILIWAWIE